MAMHSKKVKDFIQERAIPVGMPTVKDGEGNKFNMAMDSGLGIGSSAGNNGVPTSVFSVGNQAIPDSLFAWYASQGFIGYQACSILAQQWLVNKACSQKGKDAVSKWYTLSINDGSKVDNEALSFIEERDKAFKLKYNLTKAHKFNNVFGIRHVLFVVKTGDEKKDKEYYENPFNPDAIKPGTYKGMSQVDPYWITSNLTSEGVSDPMSIHFYEPEHWVVSGQKVHRSHFVILQGAEVSDFLKPSYLYGGVSLVQRIYERVYGSERTANEAPLLAMTKRLNVYGIKDMKAAIANPEVLAAANTFLSQQRDNYGVLYKGIDEEVQQLETSLTDLDSTIMTQYQLVASTADMPATKLLGTSPKGFNATGEHEIETYHEELSSVQENEFDPIIEKHHICLMKSEVEPKFGQEFALTVTWNPQKGESRKEKADTNRTNAETASILVNTGIVDNSEARDSLIADEHSGYSGLEPLADEELPEPNMGNENDPEEGLENAAEENKAN